MDRPTRSRMSVDRCSARPRGPADILSRKFRHMRFAVRGRFLAEQCQFGICPPSVSSGNYCCTHLLAATCATQNRLKLLPIDWRRVRHTRNLSPTAGRFPVNLVREIPEIFPVDLARSLSTAIQGAFEIDGKGFRFRLVPNRRRR